MTARIEAMELLSKAGWTLDRVGEAFGLSRERVRQLVANIPKEERGQSVGSVQRKTTRAEQRIHNFDKRARHVYGCDFDTLMRINEDQPLTRVGCQAYVFRQQRKNARVRRIAWKLTLPEWWQSWESSGKWSKRGRGIGKYCMSRKGDTGPYSVGNIEIITTQQNSADCHKHVNHKKRDEIGLTPRERQIFDLSNIGLTPKAISAQLGIKVNSVTSTRTNIKKHFITQ